MKLTQRYGDKFWWGCDPPAELNASDAMAADGVLLDEYTCAVARAK